MTADSNVQVAQVYAAWLNKKPDINRKREGFLQHLLKESFRTENAWVRP